MKLTDAQELKTIWINLNRANLTHDWASVDKAVTRLAEYYIHITKEPDE